MKTINIMIDLETMGNSATSAIVAIGACRFDKEEVHSNHFYTNVDLESCLDLGLSVDGETIYWWLKQSDNARLGLYREKTHLTDSLMAFKDWLPPKSDPLIWGNGASFDNVILANAYRAANIQQPWAYWNDRCYRTLKKRYPDITLTRQGTHHNALDDAISQAEHLITIWKEKGQ